MNQNFLFNSAYPYKIIQKGQNIPLFMSVKRSSDIEGQIEQPKSTIIQNGKVLFEMKKKDNEK